jgi:hypothetical protein
MENEPDEKEIKLSENVPEKVLKMWYIDYKKSSFEVKKISEIKNVIAITDYNENTSTVKNSLGEEIKVFESFEEANELSLIKKISEKKKKWDAYIKASYVLNEQIGNLYEQLNKLTKKKNKKNNSED